MAEEGTDPMNAGPSLKNYPLKTMLFPALVLPRDPRIRPITSKKASNYAITCIWQQVTFCPYCSLVLQQ